MNSHKENIRNAAAIGAMAGMRTMAAPMILSHYFRCHRNERIANSRLYKIQGSGVAKGSKILTTLEMLGDKLPMTPDRTGILPLAARAGSGALAGATVYKANGEKSYKGALIAGAVAIGAAFAVMHLRKAIVKHTFLPDVLVGLAEDVAVIAIGKALLKRGI